MIVMYLWMDHHGGAAPPDGGCRSRRARSALVAGGGGPLLAALLLVLAGYFVWRAWATGARARAGTTDGRSPVRVGHVVMSAR